MHRAGKWLLVLLVNVVAVPAATATEQKGTKPAPPVLLSPAVDAGHEQISNGVNLFVNWVDEFFGSERVYEETPKNYVKLSLREINRKGGKREYRADLSAKVNLPRMQERFKLLIESEPETQGLEGTPEGQDLLGTPGQGKSTTAAIRYVAKETPVWNIHADAGLRNNGGPDIFTRLRARRTVFFAPWSVHMAETLFWYDSLGAGETTHVDFERYLREDILFRATTEATWRKETDYFDLLQNLDFLHKISRMRSMIYRAAAIGVTEPTTHATNYILSVRWRQLIHRDWLFFEINPQIDYPQELHYAADPSLTFRLDVIF
jgi:hypothetical protein